jgi:hypothetical protein
MSYRERIPADQQHEFRELHDAGDYIENFMLSFEQDNPPEDIADVELTIIFQ